MEQHTLAVGQVWKNKRRKPTDVAVIHSFYTKSGTRIRDRLEWESPRVVCAICSDDGISMRDLHVGSFILMFPHIAFDLRVTEVEENK